MLPSSFVVLEALPLMLNGKVDRNRLPPPDGTRPPVTREFVAPRTEIEELITQTWREVIKIENVGIYDNFFELGGHSLMATQIVARLQEVFNKDVPLRVLFDAPTIAELAQELETIMRDGHAPELPPIVPVPRTEPLPLSMNQEHLWHLEQMMPRTHFFNMPYVYRLSGELNVEALEKALREIFRRHEALRTIFTEVDGHPIQVIKEVAEYLPVIDLRDQPSDDIGLEVAKLVLEEREGPFDLTVGPLLRTKLARLTDDYYLLLITMHHIISDYWSMQILSRELALLYEAFSQGLPSPIPEPVIQFADYAFWERHIVDKALLHEELAYSKKRIEAPLPVLEFRTGRKLKQQLNFWISRQPIEVDETLFTDIRMLSRKENCTPFMIVVTALNILLYLETGQRDIRIGTLVANRGRKESESVIGHFLNTVILRAHIIPEITVKELLAQVRKTILVAHAHQELPFEQLATVLEKENQIERNTLFQVLLSYQTHSSKTHQIDGLSFAPFDLREAREAQEMSATAFDLIFNLRESSTKLTGAVNYKMSVCDSSVGVTLAEGLVKVLIGMTLQLVQPVSKFSLDPKVQDFVGR